MKKIIGFCVLIVSMYAGQAQDQKIKDMLIYWDNGSATRMEDLGKVTIEFKQGNTLKGVRIWDLDKTKGKMIIEKDGCLHDKLMSSIDHIKPGKNPERIMIIGDNYELRIIQNGDFDYLTPASVFVVSFSASQLSRMNGPANTEIKKNGSVKQNIEDAEFKHEEIHSLAMDTVVNVYGDVIGAHIVHINSKEIRYKRADLPDGPVYNVLNTPSTQVIRYPNCVKVIFKY